MIFFFCFKNYCPDVIELRFHCTGTVDFVYGIKSPCQLVFDKWNVTDSNVIHLMVTKLIVTI